MSGPALSSGVALQEQEQAVGCQARRTLPASVSQRLMDQSVGSLSPDKASILEQTPTLMLSEEGD